MKFDQADGERNRRLITEGMAGLGIEAASLINIDSFIAEYTLPLAGDGFGISEVMLDAAPGGPLCRYDLQGRLWLNLARLTQIVGREHKYPLYVMASLHAANQWVGLTVVWDGFDPYLLRSASMGAVSDIHWLFLHFHYHYQRLTGRHAQTKCGFETLDIGGPPAFYARPGVVELRALRTVMEHDADLGAMTREIAARHHEDGFMHAPWASNDADAADPLWTIRRLMTYAGIYGAGTTLEHSLRDWAKRYLDGLRQSHEVFNWWDYSILGQSVRLLAEQRGVRYERMAPKLSPGISELYQQFAGRRVLFVTAYARAVEQVMTSGNIHRLWKNLTPPRLDVRTVQAFVSIYPNMPHRSWSESYAALVKRVDAAIAARGVDVVIGACGGYGIPLLHHCHQHHGLPALYLGNRMNMWFGVKQNAFAADYPAANLDYWADPFTGYDTPIPANIELVDNGRYMDTHRG